MVKKKITTTLNFKMGWLPDLPDARDLMYAAPLKVSLKMPAKVDLRSICPVVYNQGNLGSCTANALGAAFQVGQKLQKKATFMPSRLFLYYNERVMINTVLSDGGAFIRDGIKSLNKQGICQEIEWTYDDNPAPNQKFTLKPSKTCYTHAKPNLVESYQRLINNINTLKGCLAEGFPFVFGFTVYESFMTSTVRATGIMPMPSPSEKVKGGHAVMAVGYDEAKQAILVRNSWGKDWGMAGYFWMPYAYISNNNLCDDFWTIRLVTSKAAKPKVKKTTKAKKAY